MELKESLKIANKISMVPCRVFFIITANIPVSAIADIFHLSSGRQSHSKVKILNPEM